eukprot:747241-Hanusia_phi.AAC.3
MARKTVGDLLTPLPSIVSSSSKILPAWTRRWRAAGPNPFPSSRRFMIPTVSHIPRSRRVSLPEASSLTLTSSRFPPCLSPAIRNKVPAAQLRGRNLSR